jgi:hypothetical protein
LGVVLAILAYPYFLSSPHLEKIDYRQIFNKFYIYEINLSFPGEGSRAKPLKVVFFKDLR